MARRGTKPVRIPGQMPLFEPASDWVAPTALPDIPSGVTLAVDTETRDDGIPAGRGPGWVFRDGHLAGLSVAWEEGGTTRAQYVPLRHPDTANTDIDKARGWLEDAMTRAGRIVFHNQAYDQGWLSTEGITVPSGRTDDTQAMAVMLDENRFSYDLDSLCAWREVPGKDERLLREAAAAFGVDPKVDLWQLPARHVGPYGEQDGVSTLGLYRSMAPEIEAQGLTEAYRTEIDLMPMIQAMRSRGIRIDESAAEQAQTELRRRRDAVLAEIGDRVGWTSISMEHMNSPTHLEQLFDSYKVGYPRTPKTDRGSFSSDWMEGHDHWLPSLVAKTRQLNDMSEKFIGTYIMGAVHLGRIHAEIHQLRDDTGGTRSHRLSYSNPPLQQIPARDPELAPIIRSVFVPDRGMLWAVEDYSQQEPRMAVHFAAVCRMPGAEDAVRYYRDHEDADFHQMVADFTGIPRKRAKIINLALMYGMGLPKLAARLGVSLEEARQIMKQYEAALPFVAALSDFCKRRAGHRGYIRLIDGARCRFDEWEPAWRERDEPYEAPRSLGAARETWKDRRLRRAYTHKAMNRLIQGSSARQTKMAMLACWREGVLPLLQMHDELDFMFETESEGIRAGEIMRDVVRLEVPMKVDLQWGRNWGEASREAEKGSEPPGFDELWRLREAA